jgi:hypothetical protein
MAWAPAGTRRWVMIGWVGLLILIILLIGVLPTYPYSRGWGYGPSGLVGVLVLIVLIMALTGRMG